MMRMEVFLLSSLDCLMNSVPSKTVTNVDRILVGEPTPADGFDAGADEFFRKPIDFDDSLKQVQTILQPK